MEPGWFPKGTSFSRGLIFRWTMLNFREGNWGLFHKPFFQESLLNNQYNYGMLQGLTFRGKKWKGRRYLARNVSDKGAPGKELTAFLHLKNPPNSKGESYLNPDLHFGALMFIFQGVFVDDIYICISSTFQSGCQKDTLRDSELTPCKGTVWHPNWKVQV